MVEAWEHLISLGWVGDILPVVQPGAPISKGSSLSALGQTPSILKLDGTAVGIKDWTEKVATEDMAYAWSKRAEYGICVQTRHVRAIDIDVNDPELASDILAMVLELTGAVSYRGREGVSKCLVPVIAAGYLKKHVIRIPNSKHIIEFLGNGQQFVAFGKRTDGTSYFWNYGLPVFVPELSQDRYIEIINKLAISYGEKPYRLYSAGGSAIEKVAISILSDDPVVTVLESRGMVLSESPHGKLFINCPWGDSHTSQNETSTTYMVEGHNGLPGAFKCLHAHCDGRSTEDLKEFLGLSIRSNLPIATFPPGAMPLLDSPEKVDGMMSYGAPMATDKNGKFKDDMATIYNWLRANKEAIKICYDNFTGTTRVCLPGDTDYREINDNDFVKARVFLQNNYNFVSAKAANVRDAMCCVANDTRIDTALDWINSLKWDGVPRVESFCAEYMGCGDTEYARLLSLYLWTALAGRVVTPGELVRIVPVFMSKQLMGKTSAIKAIAPFENAYACISLTTKEADLARRLRGVLVAEWDELKGNSAKDAQAIKSYISQTSDTWVPKFKEFTDTYKRRCVLIGTGNPMKFLFDPTGHTRFAPVNVITPCRFERITGDRDMLWAEAKELFNAGGLRYQGLETFLSENPDIHKQFERSDPWESKVRDYVATFGIDTDESIILSEAVGKVTSESTNADISRITDILIKIRRE